MYDLNMKKVLQMTIWSFLYDLQDKPVIYGLVSSLVSPIVWLHTFFLQYQKRTLFEIAVNGQVRKLRWGLNQMFDLGLQRIKVLDAPIQVDNFIYLWSENKPLYLPQFLGAVAYDFEVEIPLSLKNLEKEITSFINKYRLPTKQFIITWI
jgi:hypothetical protein